jgi:hypothetical protein
MKKIPLHYNPSRTPHVFMIFDHSEIIGPNSESNAVIVRIQVQRTKFSVRD